MRTLTVTEFVTMDGVLQAPGRPDEDTSGGFRHGGWQPPYWDEATGEQVVEWFSTREDFLLSRTTYEVFEAWWPNAPQEGDPIATALNQKTEHVASRTLTSVDWNGTARLLTYPIVIGEGKRLFGDGAVPRAWRLLSSTTTPSGAITAAYARAGDLRAGEFTPDSTPVTY